MERSSSDWHTSLNELRIEPGLRNITELLHRMHDPQNDYRTVHVAGSDGKGSVCAMIASVLRESGVRTGLFSSPYISDRTESMSVDGKDISAIDLERVLSEVRKVSEGMEKDGYNCTFFEVLTAAAFRWFADMKAEYAIIETGMGGLLDATNVIIPQISVITHVSKEHTAFLGDTIEEIASHKAGIIKRGVPVVTSVSGVALDVIEKKAIASGSELITAGKAEISEMDAEGSSIVYKGRTYRVGIPGSYQAENLALVVDTIGHLEGGRFTDNLESGLSSVRLPARMEKVKGIPMVIDGTHTMAGMEYLVRDVERLYGHTVTVFGMLSDKDADGALSLLSRISDRMIIASPRSERAADSDSLLTIAKKYTDRVEKSDSVSEAISLAFDIAEGKTILVTGSFRMAEEAREWLRTRYA